jgi:glycosyltransferase involved in cell wall biosynthesis
VACLVDLRIEDIRKRNAWLFGVGRQLASGPTKLLMAGPGSEAVTGLGITGLGRLCDGHIRQVMREAEVFLYTSAYEGQGLPPQEALYEGTAVVAFDNSSLPEMIGPGAVLLTESSAPWEACRRASSAGDREVDALVEAVNDLLSRKTERDRLGSAGAAHVRQFTFERFQARLVEAYSSHV